MTVTQTTFVSRVDVPSAVAATSTDPSIALVDRFWEPQALFIHDWAQPCRVSSAWQTVISRSRTGSVQRNGISDKPKINSYYQSKCFNQDHWRNLKEMMSKQEVCRYPSPLHSDACHGVTLFDPQAHRFATTSSLSTRRLFAGQHAFIANAGESSMWDEFTLAKADDVNRTNNRITEPSTTTDTPALAAPSDEELTTQLFTIGHANAWPAACTPSAVREGGLDMRDGRARRWGRDITRDPSLTVPRRRRRDPEPAPPTDAQAQAVRLATETIRTRLESVAIPSANGRTRLYKGGYAYRAETHAETSEAAAGHVDYMHEANPLGLTSERDLKRWEIFQFVLGEGDTSAINAYDSQIVTIGAGFGAVSGQAGELLNRLPASMRQRLFDHGILVNGDDSFTVLDLNRGVVEHGENALHVLQVDERRLGLLITMAQSTEDVTEGTETRSAREWMLRAQFEQVTASIPDYVFEWPLPLARVAIKVRHWQPGLVSWENLRDAAGTSHSVSAMLRSARNRIWRGHSQPATGDYSLHGIETRFSTRARQAGAGAVTWAPRPTE